VRILLKIIHNYILILILEDNYPIDYNSFYLLRIIVVEIILIVKVMIIMELGDK